MLASKSQVPFLLKKKNSNRIRDHQCTIAFYGPGAVLHTGDIKKNKITIPAFKQFAG